VGRAIFYTILSLQDRLEVSSSFVSGGLYTAVSEEKSCLRHT
jgi:hypothetical protein